MFITTAWKLSKYGVISGPYFSVFSPNAGKYGPEVTPYLDTFHAVYSISVICRWKLKTLLLTIVKMFKKIDIFLNTLELGKKGYTVSFCRCAINTKPGVDKLNKKQVKQLLIKFYSEDICFTYPKDKTKAQMLFSSSIIKLTLLKRCALKSYNWMCSKT